MLDVRGLHKNYAGIAAVQDVSFEVGSGELVSLIGPNGAGKTTCFNLITGFATPTAGRVLFEGADITGRPPPRIAAAGLVRSFQKTNVLLRLSVFENVLAAQYTRGHSSLLRTLFPGRTVRETERRMRETAAHLVE